MSYKTLGQVLGADSKRRAPSFKMVYPKTKGVVTTEEALLVARDLGIRANQDEIEQLRRGMIVELEHGRYAECDRCKHPINVTDDELHLTGMIAMAHISEMPDYYVRLEKMEETPRGDPSSRGI